MYKVIAFGLLVAAATAVPAPESSAEDTAGLDCLEHENELFSCIFVKGATSLERAARSSSDIELIEGLTFVRTSPMVRSGKSLKTEVEVLKELPRDASDRTITLMSMLYNSAVSFFNSHSLKVNMPEGSIGRVLSEGRKIGKKAILPVLALVGVKLFALVPLLLGGLAIATLKALFVGKIALLIAGILAFQKLFSSSSGGSAAGGIFGKNPGGSAGWFDGASQAWPSNAVQAQPQGYYKRSFENAQADAHTMAYAAQLPSTNEAN